MRNNISIKVENLSKIYRIGLKEETPDTFVGAVKGFLLRPVENFRRLRKLSKFKELETKDVIWALRNVSFEIKKGEVVGIVGENGAGKSTLLKILARVTDPTSGYALLSGRVGSLLEVGTGMHPELTGRENIYLSGTILGMTKKEIDNKFDEIVEFANLSKFIDTPVKRYSSGMKVRLGFAIAAHLNTDILLVDEVLAVGDLSFQRKSLGKMRDVVSEGRTVLFVSHNMAAVQALCPKTMLLHSGKIVKIDRTPEVLKEYFKLMGNKNPKNLDNLKREGNGKVKLTSLKIYNNLGDEFNYVRSGDVTVIEFTLEKYAIVKIVDIAFRFRDLFGQLLFTCSTQFTGQTLEINSQRLRGKCILNKFPLAPGIYHIGFWVAADRERADYLEKALELQVIEGNFWKGGKLPVVRKDGPFLVEHKWVFEEEKNGQ